MHIVKVLAFYGTMLIFSIEDCEYWSESDEEIDRDTGSFRPPQDLTPDTAENEETKGIVKWIVLLVSFFQSRFMISNAAISWLLKFLHALLLLLGKFSCKISAIANAFPRSLYHYNNLIFQDSFKKFNVCKRCDSIYTHDECIRVKNCSYKPYPRSRGCGELLL